MPAPDVESALGTLRARRDHACRLMPTRALVTLEDAESFLTERGLLTLTPDCALPSLFGACHDKPYMPGTRGFGAWPKTKWWWGFALSERPGIHALRLHRGKRLYVTPRVVRLLDPLCRAELRRAEAGDLGAPARDLVAFLATAGPATLDDVKRELGLSSAALRQTRDRLERVGALVSRAVVLPAEARVGEGNGEGERESSELARWDQRFTGHAPTSEPSETLPAGLPGLVLLGMRAAMLAPEAEPRQWFSWPVTPRLVDELVEQAYLWRPAPGWLAAEHA